MLALLFPLVAGTAIAQTDGPPNLEDFSRKVMAAIESKDKAGLEGLSITEPEFTQYIWPTLIPPTSGPQSKPDGYFDFLRKTSAAGIEQRFAEIDGKHLAVVKVSFRAERKLKKARILQAPEVTVRAADGTETRIRFASSLLEHDGAFRVISYFYPPQSAKP